MAALNKEEDARGAPKGELRDHVSRIVGSFSGLVHTYIRSGEPDGARVRVRQRGLDKARADGNFVLLSTRTSLAAVDALREYFAKDFVEKVFRSFKSEGKAEPVRHRPEWRVRAYILVGMLAHRLRAALVLLLREAGVDIPHEYLEALLRDLDEVHRVEVRLGAQAKT